MPRGLITPTPYTWVNAHDSLFLNTVTFSLFRWEINKRELGRDGARGWVAGGWVTEEEQPSERGL